MTTRINPSNRFRWIFSAGVVMFLSANFVNAGNMLFNLLFSRWMGPALFSDLALLLTLKLSILGVLNAVQFLATEMVAKERPTRRPSIIQSYRFLSAYSSIILILCTPFLIGACYYFGWAEKLGISSELSLMVFFLGVPIYLPLALARGIAQGEIDLRRIVLSANAEMLVRLIGGAILWWAGFGITSVIFAFVLSLLTAWFFAKPTRPPRTVQPKPLRQSLPLLKALPWAAIQLTVVFALDGDVFVAKQIFDPESAGFIAAISLTQRIIFFASFSLAAILLPQVIAEIQLGNSGIRKATPILGLIALATIPILLILYFFPNEVVLILFGAEFSAISPYLYTAGLSATIVTINYFLVVFMMAHQAHRFAGLFLALSIAQIGYLYFSTHFSGADIGTFVEQKFMFQVISFALLSGLAALSAVKKFNQQKDNRMSKFRPVILCGGTGKRLWPISRKSYPKQFSNLLSSEETMLQATMRRLGQSGGKYPIFISNNSYRFFVAEQVEGLVDGPRQIIIEPKERNTAPAICAAAIELDKSDPEGIMLVAPSDHHIHCEKAFANAIDIAVARAQAGKIVIFGIVPSRAETGYGYIELESEFANKSDAVPFKQFVEKPNAEDAEKMLKSGRYLWNSGMFVFPVRTVIEAFKTHAPDIFDFVDNAVHNGEADLDFFRLSKDFEHAQDISFDHAIMEHMQGEVVPLDCGWNDLGSWQTVYMESKKDENGNAQSGPVTIANCKNSLIRSENPKVQVVGLGLENISVIAMGDAVLVADLNQSQAVGDAVKEMKAQGVCQAEVFPRDSRPWGWFETLTRRQRFRVKSIVVKPGQKLSLQSHVHRAEHWIVVEGTAKVTIGETVKMVTENESVFIPLGEVHRLENPGRMDLHLIEVQTGSYLEEDDIVRYEDVYSRQ